MTEEELEQRITEHLDREEAKANDLATEIESIKKAVGNIER